MTFLPLRFFLFPLIFISELAFFWVFFLCSLKFIPFHQYSFFFSVRVCEPSHYRSIQPALLWVLVTEPPGKPWIITFSKFQKQK